MALQSTNSMDFRIKCAKSTEFWNILAGCFEKSGYHNFSLEKAINIGQNAQNSKKQDSKKQVVTNVA